MSSLVYVDQSALDLRLTLIQGEVDPAQFHVLEYGSLQDRSFSVRAGIIGASHYVTVDLHGSRFTEVFACMDVESDTKPVCSLPISEIIGFRPPAIHEVEYTYDFGARLYSWEQGEAHAARIEQAAREALDRPDEIGLVHVFPGAVDGRIPKTILSLRWSRSSRHLHIETVHSYPNEGNIVITQTAVAA